jgi:hypothetical protein
VRLAARGSRKVGDEVEQIEDSGELAQVRRQARQVRIKAFLAAVPLTLIALALPSARSFRLSAGRAHGRHR